MNRSILSQTNRCVASKGQRQSWSNIIEIDEKWKSICSTVVLHNDVRRHKNTRCREIGQFSSFHLENFGRYRTTCRQAEFFPSIILNDIHGERLARLDLSRCSLHLSRPSFNEDSNQQSTICSRTHHHLHLRLRLRLRRVYLMRGEKCFALSTDMLHSIVRVYTTHSKRGLEHLSEISTINPHWFICYLSGVSSSSVGRRSRCANNVLLLVVVVVVSNATHRCVDETDDQRHEENRLKCTC